jgi:hypothetical protein
MLTHSVREGGERMFPLLKCHFRKSMSGIYRLVLLYIFMREICGFRRYWKVALNFRLSNFYDIVAYCEKKRQPWSGRTV